MTDAPDAPDDLFRRRRPRWPILVALLVVASVVGVLLVSLRDDATTPSARRTFDPVTPSASVSATESPSPSPSPSDFLTPTGAPTPTPVATTAAPVTAGPTSAAPTSTATPRPTTTSPRPTQTPVATGDSRDGKPGWSRGFSSCEPSGLPQSSAPYPDLTFALELPDGRSGEPLAGTIVIRTNGSTERRFTTTDDGDDGTLLDGAGRPVSARYRSDALQLVDWTVQPGASSPYRVSVQAEQCADTSSQPPPGTRAGSYRAVAILSWRTPDNRTGTWVSSPTTVRIS